MMKIVVTGSLGHISKPLTIELVEKGHQVTVISSKVEKQKDIEALGATSAIGTMEDVDFLTATFMGADSVYTMIAGVISSILILTQWIITVKLAITMHKRFNNRG
jgi:uncharacterized protein YbjT (DUF2867 family)